MRDYHKPPTIQEMERDNPLDYRNLIFDTAMDMIDMNTPYTAKTVPEVEYKVKLFINVEGICNSLERGTAKVNAKGTEILFWHPGIGEYVPYDMEFQKYLLGCVREFKAAH